ncbi:uncharacterized protein LOC115232070 isoform X1 [Octopus sinensis]|uniref:Uncharacterized protein LOC115232070 isoform X1 n=1 Tax=Octopus sinensis TaxID=2607531 RepID=A0A6P7TZF1_9MOLL|nr:uncharacterized protein LOC115232070 isoform X1 [Octopus sinensis]
MACMRIEPAHLNLANLLHEVEAEISRLENICGDKYNSSIVSYKCLKEDQISDGVQRCIKIGVKTSNHLLATPESKRDACLRMKKTSDCVEKYSGRCGSLATAFVGELVEKYLRSNRMKLECDGHGRVTPTLKKHSESTTAVNFCTEAYIEKKFRKCVKLLHPDVSLGQIINITGPTWTESQINTMCKNLPLYKPCPARIFESCDIPKMRMLGKVTNTILEYICREGFRIYLRVFTCLQTDDSTRSIIQHCIRHASSVNTKEFYFGGEYNEEKICKYNNDMTYYGNHIAHICGNQAKEFLVELVGRTINPYRTLVKCNNYNTGAIVGITVGCLVFVTVGLSIRYARRKQLFAHFPRVECLNTATVRGTSL